MAELSPTWSEVATVATGVASGNRQVKVGLAESYGSGRIGYLSFDLEQANSSRMTAVLSSMLSQVGAGPAPFRVPLSVADVVTSVTNQNTSPWDIQVGATLPAGANELFALPQLSSQSPPTWLATLQPSETGSFELGVRLPDSAGSDLISIEVDQKLGSAYSPFSTQSVTYSVPWSGSQLENHAATTLSSLNVSGTNASRRDAALSDLASLNSSPSTVAQAQANLAYVLDACSQVEGMAGVDVTEARTTLDDELRYQ
jgi:hypothetical protein